LFENRNSATKALSNKEVVIVKTYRHYLLEIGTLVFLIKLGSSS